MVAGHELTHGFDINGRFPVFHCHQDGQSQTLALCV